MKKIAIFLFIFIILCVSLIYGVLFTKTGNEYVASYIKEKVDNKEKNIVLTINKFELTRQNIIFDAVINDNSIIKIEGILSLFDRSIDLNYDFKIKNLSNLKNLLDMKLNGELNTTGKFKGDSENSIIEGNSDIAKSKSFYNLSLEDFEFKSGTFMIKEAKVEDLLNLFDYPKYVSGLISIKGNIKNFEKSNLDGKINISYDKGLFQNSVINKEFKQNIQTAIPLKSDIDLLLIGDKLEIKSNLISSVVEIFTDKTIYDMDKNQLISDYKIEVKNLNVLEQIINKKLNGNFITTGNVDYKDELTKIIGNSDIAEGITKYNFKVENSLIQDLNISVKNAKIDKLLAMLNEPVYASGILNIDGKIDSLEKDNLNGNVSAKIVNGKTINEVLNTVYNQKLTQNIDFNIDINSKLIPNKINSKIVSNSSIGDFSMSELVYDFKEKEFFGDYLIKIFDLSKLSDFVLSKMSGKVDIGGKIKVKNDSLNIDGITKIAEGIIEFNLKNDNLKSDFKDISAKDFCSMFGYPKFFDSKVKGNVEYSLLLKKGNINSIFEEGHFIENDFTRLINQFSKYDVTKDIFKNFNMKAKIDQKILSTSFDLKNENLEINTIKSNIDFENHTIDSNIKIKIKDKEFGIGVLDSLENPTVILDSKDFLKSKLDRTQQKIEDKLNKLLDKL